MKIVKHLLFLTRRYLSVILSYKMLYIVKGLRSKINETMYITNLMRVYQAKNKRLRNDSI